MTTLPALLASAFDLPQWPDPLREFPPARCPLGGGEIDRGVAVADLITPATADLADTFRGAAHVSADAARAFSASAVLKGNLLVQDGRGYRPFIARASATEDRPCWRDALLALPDGAIVVVIISDESQRRLWPRAAAGVVGPGGFPVLLHTGGRARLLTVCPAVLASTLALVEQIYAAGFSKERIAGGLLTFHAQATIRAVGLSTARRYESALSAVRRSPEFDLSVVIAQKEATP